jgi:hypothetical protein
MHRPPCLSEGGFAAGRSTQPTQLYSADPAVLSNSSMRYSGNGLSVYIYISGTGDAAHAEACLPACLHSRLMHRCRRHR